MSLVHSFVDTHTPKIPRIWTSQVFLVPTKVSYLSPLEPLCVIIEFVSGGSLDNLLRSSRVQNWNPDISYTNIWSRLTERELLKIASDVANGMKHLESKQVTFFHNIFLSLPSLRKAKVYEVLIFRDF